MDEMKLKLNTRFMRNIVAKILTRMIYKKTGYKLDILLHELNITVIDGETRISTNLEAKIESDEFVKFIKDIGLEDSAPE